MKQAVAPKKPLDELWDWMDREIDAEVVVLTEARVPKTGVPEGWNAIWTPGGIGPRRTWGTIVAARKPIELVRSDITRNSMKTDEYIAPAAASVETVDVFLGDYLWATVVGIYAFMPNSNNGHEALPGILFETLDVRASGRERIIVAGDFNLWPVDINGVLDEVSMPLYDLVGEVFDFEPMPGGVGESRIWTHKNGNSPNAAKQEIDFIFATEPVAQEMESAGGGIDLFPDAWDFSDHAPVFADFRV
jgi:exonuclease III